MSILKNLLESLLERSGKKDSISRCKRLSIWIWIVLFLSVGTLGWISQLKLDILDAKTQSKIATPIWKMIIFKKSKPK